MLNYEILYRQKGIRRPIQLVTPPVFDLISFQFPRNATYHFLSHLDNVTDIDVTVPYLANLPKKIMTDYVSELDSNIGHGVKRSVPLLGLIRPFHVKNKAFKYVRNVETVNKDIGALTVVSYSHLNELYKYPNMPISKFNKWFDTEATMWTRIKAIANVSERQNFIFVDLPDALPSASILNIFSDRVNISMLRYFDTPARLNVLELWKWISPNHRATSSIGNMTDLELSRTTLVFWYKGHWSMLGMSVLDGWIKKAKIDEDLKTTSKIVFDYRQIQKYVLKLMMSVQASGITNIADEIAETIPVVPKVEEGPDDIETPISNDDTNTPVSQVTNVTKSATNIPIEYIEHVSLDSTWDEVEADLAMLETLAHAEMIRKDIKVADLTATTKDHLVPASRGDEVAQTLAESPKPKLNKEVVSQNVFTVPTANAALNKLLSDYSEYGVLTAAEYRATLKLVEASDNIPAPHDSKIKLKDYAIIKPEELKIDVVNSELKGSIGVIDKSMLSSSLNVFDSDYVSKVLHKDIASMITHIQSAGVIIQNYEVEREESILGAYEIHTLRVKPISGVASTLHFKLPVVSKDGVFMVSGNKYRQRKQRTDLPLRKLDSNTVALTSYYGKLIVNKCTRTSNDLSEWLFKQLFLISEDPEASVKVVLGSANVFNPLINTPTIYSKLSKRFKTLSIGNYKFKFDDTDRLKLLDSDLITKLEMGDKYYLVGVTARNEPLLMDYDNILYVYKDNDYTLVGTIFSIAGINHNNAPIEFSAVKIYSKSVPIALVLGYYLGIDSLLTLLDVTYTEYPAGKRIELKPNEYTLVFGDKKIVLSRYDTKASMVLGGFKEYDKILKNYNYDEFNKKDVYLNLLASSKLTARYLDEITLIDQMFVDPITRDILQSMHEPMTLKGLLIRSSELLCTEYHPDPQDMRYQRIKGYERVAGAIYKELAQSVKSFNNRNIRGKSALELNPYAVWTRVVHDNANKIVADINPIEDLKQLEAVTYVGEGGRDKLAMTKGTRVYHKNDIGTISESTVDSSDVGVNTFTTASPLFNNMRGTVDQYDNKINGPASVLSTSALISVGATNDDPKRVNFISIQQSHTIACHGYTQPIVRTGYEQVISQRTSDMFSVSAKQDGVVSNITDKGIIVQYADGSKVGVELGRRFGNAEGSTYPHDIATLLSVGDKFTKGDNLAYNSGFFEQDIMNPKAVIWKSSTSVRTVLYESTQTHEDSASISLNLSDRLTAKTTKTRSVVVSFKNDIRAIATLKSFLESDNVLCVIEDETTSGTDLFDDDSLDTLQKLSNMTPKAKYRGVLDKIEVYYHGDKSDMSTGLKSLANASDRNLADISDATATKGYTGLVDSEYRVSGKPLMLDTAEIKFYITVDNGTGIGDKLVFGNQLKGTIGEVMDYEMTTESGLTIDAVFGGRSVDARIVMSPMLMGTTAALMKKVSLNVVNIYKGK